MNFTFNTLLTAADIDPANVRLIRHADPSAERGKTPYDLWCNKPRLFETYQATQRPENRKKLQHKYWAVFVATPQNDTLFINLYSVNYIGLNKSDVPFVHRDGIDVAGTVDIFKLKPLREFKHLRGTLLIDWGLGTRSWIQRADKQNKIITELKKQFSEPQFPGFLNLIQQLSTLTNIPSSWQAILSSTRGIYLLTCPRTKECYVGAAYGKDGFWGRWQDYIHNQHGGNVRLKSRDKSDYQVSILEVAGSTHSVKDILAMEELWKQKLQSRELGLNSN